MKVKPFYQSKKFIYAVATFLAALIITFLPEVVAMSQEQVDALDQTLPMVFVIGGMLIAGHTLTDVMAVSKEGVNSKPLAQAAHDFVDILEELLNGDDDQPATVKFSVPGRAEKVIIVQKKPAA